MFLVINSVFVLFTEKAEEKRFYGKKRKAKSMILRCIVSEGSLGDLLFGGHSLGDLIARGRGASVSGAGGNGGRYNRLPAVIVAPDGSWLTAIHSIVLFLLQLFCF